MKPKDYSSYIREKTEKWRKNPGVMPSETTKQRKPKDVPKETSEVKKRFTRVSK